MKRRLNQKLCKQAIAAYPQEAAFLWTDKDGIYQVSNVHESPETHCQIADSDLLKARKRGLKAVIHTHPDGWPVPSSADMRAQIDNDIPFGICSVRDGEVSDLVWLGLARPALEGRGFVHGVTDCYALCRDYYAKQGVDIPEYPRDWEWWDDGQSLYTQYFRDAGFTEIAESDIKEGDAILFQIRSGVPNHAGIYLGGGLFLHHPAGRDPVMLGKLSRQDNYYRWRGYATHWLRME